MNHNIYSGKKTGLFDLIKATGLAASLSIGLLSLGDACNVNSKIARLTYIGKHSKEGYVSIDESFDVSIKRIRTNEGIEVLLEGQPFYRRKNGFMVGSSEYNWNNFTEKEKHDILDKEFKALPLSEKVRYIGKDAFEKLKEWYEKSVGAVKNKVWGD